MGFSYNKYITNTFSVMRLYLDVKPMRTTGRSTEAIIDGYRPCAYCFSSKYGNYYKENDEYIYAFNFQKFNKKTKQVKNKKTGKTASTILRHKHYVGYCYRIPKAWLSINGIMVRQSATNFKLVEKNKWYS